MCIIIPFPQYEGSCDLLRQESTNNFLLTHYRLDTATKPGEQDSVRNQYNIFDFQEVQSRISLRITYTYLIKGVYVHVILASGIQCFVGSFSKKQTRNNSVKLVTIYINIYRICSSCEITHRRWSRAGGGSQWSKFVSTLYHLNKGNTVLWLDWVV